MLRDLEVLAFNDSSWTTEAFYRAKVAEQEERYAKHMTDNRLEPDIKNTQWTARFTYHYLGYQETFQNH